MNLILHKIPFTGPEIQKDLSVHNYTNDEYVLFCYLIPYRLIKDMKICLIS